ncbi:MAG: hypothetical protein Q9M48_11880 [Rhodobacterales bacterium]|nr:hypothetical protein [Rhodobacterales bacterium]
MNFALLSRLRLASFLLAGLTCLIYAILALLFDRPDPVPFWIPGVVGALTGLFGLITGVFLPRVSSVVWDELSRNEWSRSVQFGYWVAVALYPIAGAFLYADLFAWPTLFAAMGTLTGAAPLLCFAWLDTRGA